MSQELTLGGGPLCAVAYALPPKNVYNIYSVRCPFEYMRATLEALKDTGTCPQHRRNQMSLF